MVFKMLNDFFSSPIWIAVVGTVGTLTGLDHIFNPSMALVADILNMAAGFTGLAQGSGLITTVSFLAGIAVTLAGLGVTGMALEDLGVY